MNRFTHSVRELKPWAGLIVIVLSLLSVMASARVASLLVDPIRVAFNATNAQMGLLLGFALTAPFGLLSVPAGLLADRVDRRSVLAISAVIWGVGGIICGLAPNFPTLIAATALVGVGMAGVGPCAYGLIPELFDSKARITANAIYATAGVLTMGVTLIVGAAALAAISRWHAQIPLIPPTLAAWRTTFLLVAVPVPVIAVLAALIPHVKRLPVSDNLTNTVSAINRGDRKYDGLATGRRYWRRVTLFLLGVAANNLAIVGEFAWLPTAVQTRFQSGIGDIGFHIGTSTILGSLAGLGCMGIFIIVVRDYSKVIRLSIPICVWGMVLASITLIPMMFLSTANGLYTVLGIQMAVLSFAQILLPTMVQGICPDRIRSRVTGLLMLILAVMQGAGPLLVGVVMGIIPKSNVTPLLAIILVGIFGFCASAALLALSRRSAERLVDAFGAN